MLYHIRKSVLFYCSFYFCEKSKFVKCQIWKIRRIIQLCDMFFSRGEAANCLVKDRSVLYKQRHVALLAGPRDNFDSSLSKWTTLLWRKKTNKRDFELWSWHLRLLRSWRTFCFQLYALTFWKTKINCYFWHNHTIIE